MRGMPRPPPKQLSPERRAWLTRHVADELAVWDRVVRRMGLEGFDDRSGEYRRAWDVWLALSNTARQHRPRSAGIWSAAIADKRRGQPTLTDEQDDALAGAASAALRDLMPVLDYIDAGGFPCKLLAANIRCVVRNCEGINMLMGRLGSTTGGGQVPEPPADPTIWMGDGI